MADLTIESLTEQVTPLATDLLLMINNPGPTSAPMKLQIGNLPVAWTQVSKTGSNLTDLATRAHAGLTGVGVNDHHNQAHAIDGGDHTASGLTTRHVLRATGATTFAFGAIQEADLPALSGYVPTTRTVTAGNGHVAGGGGSLSADISLAVGAGSGVVVGANDVGLDWGAPTISTIEPDDVAAAGASTNPARSDHKHAILCAAPGANSVSLAASAEGTGTNFARADHTHSLSVAITPTWTGAHIFQANLTSRNLLPETGETYDIGSNTLRYRKLYCGELETFIMAQNTISVVGGTMVIGHGQGVLPSDVTDVALTVDFGMAMTVGDFVLFKSNAQLEYMTVGALSAGTTYNVTRDVDGSGANAWSAGTVFLILGQSGDARIELDTVSSPNISLFKQGATYNTKSGSWLKLTDAGWTAYGTDGVTAEVYVSGTDGKLYAGGGDVVLDTNGVTIASGTDWTHAVAWNDGTLGYNTGFIYTGAGAFSRRIYITAAAESTNPGNFTTKQATLLIAGSLGSLVGNGKDASGWTMGLDISPTQFSYYTDAKANAFLVDGRNGRVGVNNASPTYTVDITGNLKCSTGFGCNSKNPQTAYASGGALDAYVTGAFGLDSDGHMTALYNLVVAIRAALVANGIMS